MMQTDELKARIEEQARKAWDTVSIGAWLKGLTTGGIPRKVLDFRHIADRRQAILDGVQVRAEECTFLGRI